MATKIRRLDLYEQVWQTPISTLCKQYGLSDNGLRKICDALDVPTPPKGYWAKRAHGKASTIPPLSEPTRDEEYVVDSSQQRGGMKLDASIALELKALRRSEQEPASRIAVDTPARWHPAIAGFRKVVQEQVRYWDKQKKEFEARKDERRRRPSAEPILNVNRWQWSLDNGGLLFNTHKAIPFRVARGEHDRALVILDAICKAASARGFAVDPLNEESERLKLHKQGATVEVRIASDMDVTRVPDPWMSQFVPGATTKRSSPTGRLRLHVGPYSSQEKKFSDREGQPLELQLNDVFAHIHKLVAKHIEEVRARDAAAKAAEVRRIAHEAEQAKLKAERVLHEAHLAEIERLKQVRLAKEAALIEEAHRWQQAEAVRQYVAHIVSHPGGEGAQIREWARWAKAVATSLDPTVARLAESGGRLRNVNQ